jgi:hypothetical protein
MAEKRLAQIRGKTRRSHRTNGFDACMSLKELSKEGFRTQIMRSRPGLSAIEFQKVILNPFGAWMPQSGQFHGCRMLLCTTSIVFLAISNPAHWSRMKVARIVFPSEGCKKETWNRDSGSTKSSFRLVTDSISSVATIQIYLIVQ